MNLIIIALITGLTVGGIAALRNYLTYLHSKRAADFIYDQENWWELQRMYNPASRYNDLKYDFTKWTYKQMFPELN